MIGRRKVAKSKSQKAGGWTCFLLTSNLWLRGGHILWRVPAGLYPVSPDRYRNNVVKSQGHDGRTTTGGSSLDLGAVLGPPEVVRPALFTRVKEAHVAAGFWISSGHLIGLEVVAQSAGEPKILFVLGPTAGTGNEVFDFQWSQHQVLRAEAVSTSLARLLPNTISDFLGNVRAHGSGGSRNPRRTASRTAIAFRSSPSW